MNLLEASKLVRREHVDEAVRRLAAHADFEWLYKQTGRQEPDHRYVVVDGRRFPSKAFGFLVAQIAGNSADRSNDMNVNQAIAPLLRLGYKEVHGPGRDDDGEQRQARRESYYKALARPQQAAFRQTLLRAYGGMCAITGCGLSTVLEAAHVIPFRARGADTLANGILVRIDLHRLFDDDDLAINPTTLMPTLSATASGYLGPAPKPVRLPAGGPGPANFNQRWIAFKNDKAA